MHPLYQKAAGLTETVVAAAIEVHRDKGPGLIESMSISGYELQFDIMFGR